MVIGVQILVWVGKLILSGPSFENGIVRFEASGFDGQAEQESRETFA